MCAKTSSPSIEETLLPNEANDVLELDEVWSFIHRRGDRSVIPESYRRCHSYSDFWSAYSKVFDEETHRSVGKWSGGTILCASALLGMSAKHYHFPSVIFGIRS
jgi:hypothetical protein